ncbi:TRAP transporter large permease [Sulfitobacter sp. KE34]|uniref:TRAP transporter large permease n=1 Tax=unclassified Sulfitobacter TaxID=196795 RepID=UPI0023E2886D|nr:MULTISPECIES: TRAP transporter large permease [unclassified Sulfitobacter]MDF3352031.1 TRAP transporter large permease [Sulfitobacter sp. KE12]MDF3355720.1 TRAP transporter large permease [Sulfitobacter sp. KE27]MDF3359277.1 TRAP transporter large permease [Sulfitobacter sp. KE33]MDF3366659.1 TRAP transporter large permease [Sulfitobacter sp. Ks34]MDF3370401.1 TRAP transporter large permease [Sulfitobacter sp. Ks43]
MKTGLSFAILIAMAMPVAFVLIGATFAFMLFESNFRVLAVLPGVMFSGLEVFDLLAIPLFILLGEIMNAGSITRKLINAALLLLGRIPNALAYVCLTANLMLASIVGSATAQIAIMTKTMVGEMEREGYPKGFSVALTAAAGILGPIIPPSMPFILYGVIAQVSVADMFLAGILPGILLFAGLALLITLRRPQRESSSNTSPTTARDLGVSPGRVLLEALAALSIPAVIVIGISFGIVTPTESAVLAVAIALVVGGLVFRDLTWRDFPLMLSRTAQGSGLVLILIASAKVFGWVLTYYHVPQAIAGALQIMTTDPTVFMLLVFAFCLVVGAFLDGIAAMIILVPILLPVATGVYGVNPVHFGVVVCMTFAIGLLTPPVGLGLYISAAISGLAIMQIVRDIAPFVALTIVVVALIAAFPVLTLTLLGY